jgi:hypothetical protein
MRQVSVRAKFFCTRASFMSSITPTCQATLYQLLRSMHILSFRTRQVFCTRASFMSSITPTCQATLYQLLRSEHIPSFRTRRVFCMRASFYVQYRTYVSSYIVPIFYAARHVCAINLCSVSSIRIKLLWHRPSTGYLHEFGYGTRCTMR